MLTAAELNQPDDVEAFIGSFWEQLPTLENEDGGIDGKSVKGSMKTFTEERVQGVLGNLAEIDGILQPLLDNWDLYRLGSVEKAVLRLGIWELKFSDVPAGAVINEAVDLVNWFSTPKSRTLVNAVLDKFSKLK